MINDNDNNYNKETMNLRNQIMCPRWGEKCELFQRCSYETTSWVMNSSGPLKVF